MRRSAPSFSSWRFACRASENACETSGPLEYPVELFKSVKITHVDVENATVELADGAVHSGDLLIGADGLHSVVRSFAIKDDLPLIDTNWNIYRFLLPRQEIMEDDVLRLAHPRVGWHASHTARGIIQHSSADSVGFQLGT